MKRKVTSLILGLAICLCMCGCEDIDEENIPWSFVYPISMAKGLTAEDIEIKTVDSGIIDKCFERIKLGPATLTLPMNVSDLPKDIVCTPEKYDEQGVDLYNGVKLLTAGLHINGNSQVIGHAIILCTDAENYSDGVIMALMTFSSDANISLGDISLNMSYDEIDKAMGCGGEANGACVYVSNNGRSIFFSDFEAYKSSYSDEKENQEKNEYPDFLGVSTDPELYVNFMIQV